MKLKHLETFVEAARSGSFSAAARKLNSSQPAISMRIQELERDLDTVLMDRSHRRIQLTPKGREFLDYARRILALTEEAQTRLGSSRSLSGRVRLAVTETVALTWLPEFVGRLNEAFPEIVIELDVDLTAGVWNRVKAEDVDLALMPGPIRGPELMTRSLGFIRYDWMASPSLNIPTTTLTPKDLAPWPVITLSQDSNTHGILEDWFGSADAKPRRIDVCNSLGVIASLAKAGIGVSLLPPAIFQQQIAERELMVINTRPKLAPLEFQAVYPRASESPLVRYMVDLACEVSTFRVGGEAAA